jgi:predicted metal-dependent phosphoesterase TrpH
MPVKPLKIDLHTHTSDDPEEPVKYSSCQLIDKAHRLGYDAISITNHNGIAFNEYLCAYARERGIILIPGTEINIFRKHVLVINAHEEILSARTFDDVRRLKNSSHLVVAPHPFFPGSSSLLGQVRKNIDIFDAIEYSWFYHDRINFNRFAIRLAENYNKPLIGTSDCHHLEKFGCAYSLVEAEKDPEAILDAVKRGRVQISAAPLEITEFVKHGAEHIVDVTYKKLRRLWNGKE